MAHVLVSCFQAAAKKQRSAEFLNWVVDNFNNLVSERTPTLGMESSSAAPDPTTVANYIVDEALLKKGFMLESGLSKKKALAAWKKFEGSCDDTSGGIGHNAELSQELGLGPNQVMVNGRVIAGGADDIRSAILDDQMELRDAVAGGYIKDGKKSSATQRKVVDFFLRTAGPAPFHPNFTPNAAGDVRLDQRKVTFPTEFIKELHIVGDEYNQFGAKLPLAVLFVSSNDLRWFQIATEWASDGLGRLAIVVSVQLGDFARCLHHAFTNTPLEDLPHIDASIVMEQCPSLKPDEQLKPPSVAESMLSIAAGVHSQSAWVCGDSKVDLPENDEFPLNARKLLRVHGCPGVAIESLSQASPGKSDLKGSTKVKADLKSMDFGESIDSDFASFEKFIHSVATPASLRLSLEGEENAPKLLGVVDPLCDRAPTVAAFAEFLHRKLNAEIELVLLPFPWEPNGDEKSPLRKYTRSALDNGIVEFTGLKTQDTLEFGFVLSPQWVISPWESQHDLDNLRASNGDVSAQFTLEALLVEGKAFQSDQSSIAQGLQIELLAANNLVESETRAMANQGYVSFAAPPGVYGLSLKSGPSDDVFTLESSDRLSVTSWMPPDEKVVVELREGKKPDDLFVKTFGKKLTKKQRERWQRKQHSFALPA